MRRTAVNLAALAAIVLAAGAARAQQAEAKPDPAAKQAAKPAQEKTRPNQPAKPADKALADRLAEALANNPDVRVAEAKLQAAEAELRRLRLQVTQKMVALDQDLKGQQAAVAYAQAILERYTRLAQSKAVTQQLVDEARQKLLAEKAKLASQEAELSYLLGNQNLKNDPRAAQFFLYRDRVRQGQQLWQADRERSVRRGLEWLAKTQTKAQVPNGVRTDKLRKALDATVTIKVEANTPLGDALEFLTSKAPGLNFRVVSGGEVDLKNQPIELDLKDVPVGAVIQAIQDTLPDLRFAVRDYGVLVTSKEKLPPNALLLYDFWKGEGGKQRAKPNPASKPAN